MKKEGAADILSAAPPFHSAEVAGAVKKTEDFQCHAAVNELERAGHIERRQTTGEGGKFGSNEYIIHEQAVSFPTSGNPTQLNKGGVTKDQAITDRSITHSSQK